MEDEDTGSVQAEELSDYEVACLQAAYSDLFGQEYALTLTTPSPAEPSWLPED